MGVKVYWTQFAKKELKGIFEYHKENASVKIAAQIVKRIVDKANTTAIFPKAGANEELLVMWPQGFRFVVSTNYKIVYWFNEPKNRIEIVDVFDTRQNPVKMGRSNT